MKLVATILPAAGSPHPGLSSTYIGAVHELRDGVVSLKPGSVRVYEKRLIHCRKTIIKQLGIDPAIRSVIIRSSGSDPVHDSKNVVPSLFTVSAKSLGSNQARSYQKGGHRQNRKISPVDDHGSHIVLFVNDDDASVRQDRDSRIGRVIWNTRDFCQLHHLA